jgi:hypothetical protein
MGWFTEMGLSFDFLGEGRGAFRLVARRQRGEGRGDEDRVPPRLCAT